MHLSSSLLAFSSLEIVIFKTIQNNIGLTDFSKATLCSLIFRLCAWSSCVPCFTLFFSDIVNFLCSTDFTKTFYDNVLLVIFIYFRRIWDIWNLLLNIYNSYKLCILDFQKIEIFIKEKFILPFLGKTAHTPLVVL